MSFSLDFLADLDAGIYPDDPELLTRLYTDEGPVEVLAARARG